MIWYGLKQADYITIAISFVVCHCITLGSQVLLNKYSPSYRKCTRAEQAEWGTRVTSSAHAIVVVAVLSTEAFRKGSEFIWIPDDIMYWQTEAGDRALGICIGYFLADLFYVLYYRMPPVWHSVLHHLLATEGSLVCLMIDNIQWFPTYLLWTTEVTNPFNNAYWMAVRSYPKGKVPDIYATMFTGSWLIFRVLNNFPVIRAFALNANLLFSSHIVIQATLYSNLLFLMTLHIYFFYFSLGNPHDGLPWPSWILPYLEDKDVKHKQRVKKLKQSRASSKRKDE
eukprot:TRINITY_DN1807_c0_g1_i1.p1 TRINITY_DN1807_c0_g1~~TRINITY_DN1807_c0_g1_i1.p1  ORF type:complete len:283 (+),score=42.96 TRINITY_DN1807_c0_g1_i1:307-1155(+)